MLEFEESCFGKVWEGPAQNIKKVS